MTGQTARDEEDGVDADVVSEAQEARRQPLGGDGDTAKAVLVERHGRGILRGARLHFDEGKDPAAPGDQVDFTAGHSRALGQNAPAMQTQPPGRQPLGLAAALLGKLAAVQRLSSSARA